jgi:hypothetical protein
MKRGKGLPIPQKEFGFTPDTINLFQEFTGDGERISREHEDAEKARQRAEQAQVALIQIER